MRKQLSKHKLSLANGRQLGDTAILDGQIFIRAETRVRDASNKTEDPDEAALLTIAPGGHCCYSIHGAAGRVEDTPWACRRIAAAINSFDDFQPLTDRTRDLKQVVLARIGLLDARWIGCNTRWSYNINKMALAGLAATQDGVIINKMALAGLAATQDVVIT